MLEGEGCLHKGASIKYVRKIFGFLDPLPPCPHFCKTVCPQNRPIFWPPHPLAADVLNGWPLITSWFLTLLCRNKWGNPLHSNELMPIFPDKKGLWGLPNRFQVPCLLVLLWIEYLCYQLDINSVSFLDIWELMPGMISKTLHPRWKKCFHHHHLIHHSQSAVVV